MREPIRSPSEPTAAGSAADGTARQTRSTPASSISPARFTAMVSGRLTPGRYRELRRLQAISAAFSCERVPSCTSSPPRASSTATAVPQLPAPITAALRSGGRPPSHSHWSSTFGQIRAVTVAARDGDGCSVRGKVTGLPTRSLTFRGRIRQPRRTCSVPCTAIGTTAAPVSRARRPTPRFGVPSEPRRIRVPSGKMQTVPPRSRTSRAVSMAVSSDCPRRIGKAPTRERIHPRQRLSNSSTLATYCIGRRHGSVVPITNGSRKLRWFEAMITPPLIPRACSRPTRERRSQTRNAGCRIRRASR